MISRSRAKELLAEGLKHCSKCNKALPVAAFRKDKKVGCGLSARCRDCLSEWGQRCAAKGKPFLSLTASTMRAKIR